MRVCITDIMENWNQENCPREITISADYIQKVRVMECLPVIAMDDTKLFAAKGCINNCKHIEALK